MVRQLLALVPLLTALAGCITDAGPQQPPLRDRLQGFLGTSESRIYEQIGPPERSFPTADGGKIIEYTDRETRAQFTGTQVDSSPSCGPLVSQTRGVIDGNDLFATTTSRRDCMNFNTGVRPTYENVTRFCRASFVVDKRGIIQSFRYNGDLC